MDYTLLKEMIQYVEKFQNENPKGKLEDFVIWLNTQLFIPNSDSAQTAHDELLISYKILHLNKTLKRQTKNILSTSKLSSIDEYSFLLHLDYQKSFRKMELVDLHNLEAPTGIEIIKRLLRSKLVEEFPDPEDGRAKRIKITHAGIQEVQSIQPKINLAFTNFTEPLGLDEKIQLSGILEKLMR